MNLTSYEGSSQDEHMGVGGTQTETKIEGEESLRKIKASKQS